MRRIPAVNVFEQHTGAVLPMDSPTRKTSRIYGENPALDKLDTRLELSKVVPVGHPHAGQGAVFPAFPNVMPSTVAPDSIKRNYGVAINGFSPSYHSNVLSGIIPEMAIAPPKIQGKIPSGRRGTGGHYSVPTPLTSPKFLTSSEWLANQTVR